MAGLHRFSAVLISVGVSGLLCGRALSQVGSGPGAGNPAGPTLFLVGNGDPAVASSLGRFLDPAKIHVVDRSGAGNGVRRTIEGGSWTATLAMVRPGDFVLIQFGRNGGSDAVTESLPGVSDDARRVAGPSPQHGNDVVQSYGWYLRRFAVEVIARGATPILCAPVTDDAAEQSRDEVWTKAIAVQQRIAFLDVPPAVSGVPGAAPVNAAQPGKNPATPEGTATALVAALRGLPDDPVAGYFSAEGNSVAPYRPPPAATTPPL